MTETNLEAFIIRAKSATWLTGGPKSPSSRAGSIDLRYVEGALEYLDSYFGSTDFLGQEVVYEQTAPVWVMNYYGRILEPTHFDGARAAAVVKVGRGALYLEHRFLGDHRVKTDDGVFYNQSSGDHSAFWGREWIEHEGQTVYELVYHGGFVKS